MLFEKSGNFLQSEHRNRFDSSPPPVCFHLLFKDPPPPSTANPGFPTADENIRGDGGGSSKFDGGGLKSIPGGSMGEDKNSVEKYLWWSSFDSKVAGHKPASLKIYYK